MPTLPVHMVSLLPLFVGVHVLLGENIFVMFSTDIPMSTNFAPLLSDLFLNSYEADFMQELLKKKENMVSLLPLFVGVHVLLGALFYFIIMFVLMSSLHSDIPLG
jgi:hypothetical protein